MAILVPQGATMRKLIGLGVALIAFATFAASAPAADPPVTVPFPATSVGPVFIAAQTVNTSGAMASWFAPGSTVVFRAYAVDTKLGKTLTAKDVTFFYVTIPNQPNVKLKYNATAPGATAKMPWTGSWTVPATYPAGLVDFKILAKTVSKHRGLFVQMPVSTSQLNVSSTAAAPFGPGPAPAASTASAAKNDLALYVDSVNGTAPAGAPTRPVGCTQTNVYKRGERVVIRTWGFDLKDGTTLSTDNVDTATFTFPGQTPVVLAWGAHGATNAKVWFWTNFFAIPAGFPLGDVTVKVAFKTDSGHTGTFDYSITIVP
jgi:hypothetical protein